MVDIRGFITFTHFIQLIELYLFDKKKILYLKINLDTHLNYI